MIALCLYCPSHAQWQEGTGFTRYTRHEGLSNNSITGLVQDSLGYIWIGTAKGINRFDGRFFTSYYSGSTDLPLLGTSIGQLKTMGDDIIGSTNDGAFSYNIGSHRFTTFVVPIDSIIRFWANQVFEASRDGKGNYLLSTKTGLFAFDSTGKIIDRYDYNHPADAGRVELLFGGSLYLPGDGTVLQENINGFARYNPSTNHIDTDYLAIDTALRKAVFDEHGHRQLTYTEFHNQLYLFNPERNALQIFRFRDHRLLSFPLPFDGNTELNGIKQQIFVLNDSLLAILGRSTGFYLMHCDPATQQLRLLGGKRFDSLDVTNVLLDRDGRIWVGTDDGLYKQNLSNPVFKAYDIADDLPEIKNCNIRAIYPDSGKLFIGLSNRGGILVLDKATLHIEKHIFLVHKDSIFNYIDFFIPYSPDTLWVGTARGLFWLNRHNYNNGRVPTTLIRLQRSNGLTYTQDNTGHIWLSFGGLNRVQRYDRATRQFTELTNEQYPKMRITHCFSMATDNDGNLWLAGDGLCRWNWKKKDIDTLIPFPNTTPFLRNYFAIIGQDKDDNLWLYSVDNGILRFNYHSGQMNLERQENDLTDGFVLGNTGIIRDTIWIGTENGMLAFDIKDRSVRLFPYGEGVPQLPITGLPKGMIYDQGSNCFYIASRHHLITFRPQLDVAPEKKPRLFVDAIRTTEGILPVNDDRAELHYPDNSVTVSFNAIDYSNPEGNRFAWQVTPSADSGWHLLNEQHSVSFSNLSSGTYHIRLRLFSPNNRWPEQYKDITLIVHPPFWTSKWFVTLVVLALLAATTLAYRYRLKRIREKLNLDKQVAEYEMKALHAQMNPHFIFNALNSIREMILLDDNRNASRYLSRFARLIRLNLEHSKLTFISLQQNIEYLESYLEMEQLRFPDFSFRIHVSKELDRNEVRLAPMLIQPLVENAIWHGLLPKDKDKWVHIRFFHEAGQLVCEIEDNGIGIRESLNRKSTGQNTHRSVGISNIQERIAVLNEKYRIRCSLVIRDKTEIPGGTDTGTIITLIFPAKEEELIG
jgi:ligand-binding sensor domain-containing protein/two-component sensor histidine kinase